MGTLSTTYTPRDVTATMPGGGNGTVGGGMGGVDWTDFLQQMINKKLAEKEQRMIWENEDRQAAKNARSQEHFDPRAQRMGNMQEQALRAQTDAVIGRAPKKWNEGPGIVPGWSTDPLGMTGAQREAYLPKNAVAPDKMGLFDEMERRGSGVNLGGPNIGRPSFSLG